MGVAAMSAEHTGTEVFEDVDPDPDAVLDEFGVGSPDELADADADAGGAHDPISDERVDADDTTAAELFADLEAVADGDSRGREPDETAESRPPTDDGAVADRTAAESVPEFDEFEEFEAPLVGEPGVIGREDEGLVEATAAELNAVAERTFDSGETADEEPTDESGAASPDDGDAAEPDDRTVDWSDGSSTASSSSERTLTVSAGTSDDLELVGPGPTATRVSNDAFGRAGAGGS